MYIYIHSCNLGYVDKCKCRSALCGQHAIVWTLPVHITQLCYNVVKLLKTHASIDTFYCTECPHNISYIYIISCIIDHAL